MPCLPELDECKIDHVGLRLVWLLAFAIMLSIKLQGFGLLMRAALTVFACLQGFGF